MSSIKEVKKNASKKVYGLKKTIECANRLIKHLEETQICLDDCAGEGIIRDGEYLKGCNDNMIHMKRAQDILSRSNEQLIFYSYVKKHGQHPKIEFSDSDSDDEPFIGPARRFTFENQNW